MRLAFDRRHRLMASTRNCVGVEGGAGSVTHNLILTGSNADEFHRGRAQPSGPAGRLRVHGGPNTSAAFDESVVLNHGEHAATKGAACTRTTAVQRKRHDGPVLLAVWSSLGPGERRAKARNRSTVHAFLYDQSPALLDAYREHLRRRLSLVRAECRPGRQATQVKSIRQGTPLPPPS